MASRASRGCLRCRERRVKCDEARPSCKRCVRREELCVGYRDESTLLFRDETEKAARRAIRRRASTQSLSGSSESISSERTKSIRFPQNSSSVADPSDFSADEISKLNLPAPYPWIKSVPESKKPSNIYLTYFKISKLKEDWLYGGLSVLLPLSALADALAEPKNVPDDYTLMTVVVLDLFETVFMHDAVPIGSHAQGMAQILRLRGPDQVYGARGWSLFRLAHHRLQKQQLAFLQKSLPESDAWLDTLNEELPWTRAEKNSLAINKVCQRARELRKNMDDSNLSLDKTLVIIKEMLELDHVSTTWRNRPEWQYRTIHRQTITQDEHDLSKLPDFIELHRDVWIAYEWNYYRTARIILHEHLLQCLDRYQGSNYSPSLLTALDSFRETATMAIRTLVNEILSTVPQSLGDVDHEGRIIRDSGGPSICKGLGGYFLLWPIKISKNTRSARPEQRSAAQTVFERIRECTGMKSALGEASSI
ncbi:hypothetical protein B7494_g2269 [Chlorociboria aeruginascens]|nr:hypothetical protein B7494_g2269 [Chlorociboria aeruginascens]